MLSHGFFLLFLKLLQLCQSLSPRSFSCHSSHFTLYPLNDLLPISLLQLSLSFLFFCQYKFATQPHAFFLIPSFDTAFIGSTRRYWFAWCVLNPSTWPWWFHAGPFAARLIGGASLGEASVCQAVEMVGDRKPWGLAVKWACDSEIGFRGCESGRKRRRSGGTGC